MRGDILIIGKHHTQAAEEILEHYAAGYPLQTRQILVYRGR